MNENTAIANQSSRRPLWDTPTPSHISVWRRARRFAHFAFVPLLAVLLSTTALAQTIHVAGQLLIDLNATRGLTTNMGMSTNAGETNVIAWANYGILGGEFDAPLTSVYASTITTTNPPALTNFAGVYAPSSPGGGRLMVASFPPRRSCRDMSPILSNAGSTKTHSWRIRTGSLAGRWSLRLLAMRASSAAT